MSNYRLKLNTWFILLFGGAIPEGDAVSIYQMKEVPLPTTFRFTEHCHTILLIELDDIWNYIDRKTTPMTIPISILPKTKRL